MANNNRSGGNGYEYEITGRCKKTGRPVLAPIVWSHKMAPRPHYATCVCCAKRQN